MYYLSTRDGDLRLTSARAIAQGLSPDGGLLTPATIPQIPGRVEGLVEMNYQQRAVYVMGSYLDDFSAAELSNFARAAYGGDKFSSPDVAPVRPVDKSTYCLELWHGPTCAFKDMALQMLPHLLTASLQKNHEDKTVCILVATSGDTGKAAMEGFKDVDRTRILVFYPRSGVSAIQQLQMVTQEGNNVGVCAVEGNFDDAQTGVKKLFSDQKLAHTLAQRGYFFSSANSINWGRVLPQIVYYVSAWCDLLKSGVLESGSRKQGFNVCVPTGNFGDILAAYYAMSMGVPIRKLICASNSNNVLTDFIKTGVYDRNRTFYNTMSPSMDILISSNLERLLFAFADGGAAEVKGYMDELSRTGRYEVSDTIRDKLGMMFAAGYCDEQSTARQIGKMWLHNRYLIDPHTAVAFHVLEQYRAETGDETPTVVVSTASPFKFCQSVLPALGAPGAAEGTEAIGQLSRHTGVAAPEPLAALAGKPVRFRAVTEKDHMADRVLEMLA